jgi:polysaccharide export outer membrane protein
MALLLASALVPMGCSGAGPYVWANDLPSEDVSPPQYLISPGDVLSVRVFAQDAMTTKAKVRSDGKISIPFVGDVDVQGKAPATVARELEAALKNFINAPNVTITVEEFQPMAVSVIGEVAHPGPVPIGLDTSMLDVLASAGGLTEFANRDKIFVLRRHPVARRIRFTYELLTQPPSSHTFRLHAGDIVVVE